MTDSSAPEASSLQATINDSLAMVWKRYVGHRPSDITTEVRGNRVECVSAGMVEEFAAVTGPVEKAGNGRDGDRLTTAGYERDAAAAVSSATRRRVVAVIRNHDTTTDTATEIFLLDRPAKRPQRSTIAEVESGADGD
jgi:hypothetical protein